MLSWVKITNKIKFLKTVLFGNKSTMIKFSGIKTKSFEFAVSGMESVNSNQDRLERETCPLSC